MSLETMIIEMFNLMISLITYNDGWLCSLFPPLLLIHLKLITSERLNWTYLFNKSSVTIPNLVSANLIKYQNFPIPKTFIFRYKILVSNDDKWNQFSATSTPLKHLLKPPKCNFINTPVRNFYSSFFEPI